jgi:ketosteroid isomerase-like protein
MRSRPEGRARRWGASSRARAGALLSALLLIAGVPASLPGQCPEAERRALEQLDHTWSEATQRGDRAALDGILADDFEGVAVAGSVGKAATIDAAVRAAEQNRANPGNAPVTRYDYYLIACTPTTGTVTHRNTTTSKVDGVERVAYSRSVHVMEKRNGHWLVVSNAGHALDDIGQLYYLEREWNDAIRNKDAAWVERNYARDATDISALNGAIWGKAQALADIRSDTRVYEVVETSEMSARLDGNTAIVTGIFHIKGRTERNEAFERRSRYTDVWIKRDGRWQMWASQGTLIPQP